MNNKTILEAFLTTLVISLGWHYYASALLFNSMFFMLILVLSMSIMRIGYLSSRGELKADSQALFRRKFASFCLTLTPIVYAGLLAWAYLYSIPTFQRTPGSFAIDLALAIGAVLATSIVCIWGKHRPIRFSVQAIALLGSLIFILEIIKIQIPPDLSKSIIIGPPLTGTFYTLNGGNSRLDNSQLGRTPPKYLGAFTANTESFYQGARSTVEERSKVTFGVSVISPASGTLYASVDHLPDTALSRVDANHPLGNYVSIQTAPDRFVFITNLKQNSQIFEKGDSIQVGQVIGQVGQSALLSECMLALLVIDSPDLFSPNTRSIPYYFDSVTKKAAPEQPGPFFPRRNDLFQSQ